MKRRSEIKILKSSLVLRVGSCSETPGPFPGESGGGRPASQAGEAKHGYVKRPAQHLRRPDCAGGGACPVAPRPGQLGRWQPSLALSHMHFLCSRPLAWGRGLGGGLLLFSLAHFLGLLVSSLCGSGDREKVRARPGWWRRNGKQAMSSAKLWRQNISRILGNRQSSG